MGTRVTGAELKEIIDTNVADQILETQFIDTANTFVNEQLLTAGLTDAMLKKIELYLAAHFLAISEEHGGLVVEKIGDATNMLADVYKNGGLYGTRFGQQAILLDTSDTLARFGTQRKALFRVV